MYSTSTCFCVWDEYRGRTLQTAAGEESLSSDCCDKSLKTRMTPEELTLFLSVGSEKSRADQRGNVIISSSRRHQTTGTEERRNTFRRSCRPVSGVGLCCSSTCVCAARVCLCVLWRGGVRWHTAWCLSLLRFQWSWSVNGGLHGDVDTYRHAPGTAPTWVCVCVGPLSNTHTHTLCKKIAQWRKSRRVNSAVKPKRTFTLWSTSWNKNELYVVCILFL